MVEGFGVSSTGASWVCRGVMASVSTVGKGSQNVGVYSIATLFFFFETA